MEARDLSSSCSLAPPLPALWWLVQDLVESQPPLTDRSQRAAGGDFGPGKWSMNISSLLSDGRPKGSWVSDPEFVFSFQRSLGTVHVLSQCMYYRMTKCSSSGSVQDGGP